MARRPSQTELQLPTVNVARVTVEERIPGLKTSAAFFTSLRANLKLATDLYPSPASTPPSLRGSHADISYLPPPSPLAFVTEDLNDSSTDEKRYSPSQRGTPTTAAGIQISKGVGDGAKKHNGLVQFFSLLPEPLSPPTFKSDQPKQSCNQLQLEPMTYLTTSELEAAAALSILADSISDQQRLALCSLFTHPLHIALYLLLLYATKCLFWTLSRGNIYNAVFSIGMAWTGLTLAILAAASFVVRGYGRISHGIFNEWLGPTDELIVARCPSADDEEVGGGGGIVGCVVLEWVFVEPPRKKAKRPPGRGFIRGWAVAPEFRYKGIGANLLRETAAVAKQRGGALAFADGHAHAERVLVDMYNRLFDKRDRRAQEALMTAITDVGGTAGFATTAVSKAGTCEHGRRASYSGKRRSR